MFYRSCKNTSQQISLLGFGCMRLPKLSEDKKDINFPAAEAMIDYAYAHGVNYFDTAYPYHGGMSETFIGQALKKYPRDSFYLASKMPSWMVSSMEDVERIFEEQLQKCQVDYFDFYLCHALDSDKLKAFRKLDIIGYLQRQKEAGEDPPTGLLLPRHTGGFEGDYRPARLGFRPDSAQLSGLEPAPERQGAV